MFTLFLTFIILALYAHLYLHFIVNPNNDCTIVEDITKEEITNQVYVKQPFIFNASHLRDIQLQDKLQDKLTEPYGDVYAISYVAVPLLEPYVRCFKKQSVVHFNKKKKWLHVNNSCRTFYRCHKGDFQVCCIHPNYKHLISSHSALKDNPDFIRLTLQEDSMLFLPPYWYVQITPLKKDSMIDKIQYFTPLNKVANAISKILR